MGETQQRGGGLRWNGEVNAGHILQALVVGCGVIIWALVATSKADQTARDLETFQKNIRDTVQGIQQQVSQGLRDIRQDITTLPDQQARLNQVERRLTEGDARDVAQDGAIARIERQAIETRADVNNLRAASGVSLPGAPGIRR